MKLDSVVKNMTKAHGEGTASIGVVQHDTARIPTDTFAFDLASGGGFPEGRISVVYGPKSSGKTNLCLKAIAQYQKLYPEMKCVFLDVEKSFDSKWAKALGVNVDELVYMLPNFAEEAIDMFSAVLQAEDAGLIVVDSVAALTPMKEAESSADRQQVGGNSLLIGSMMRKAIVGMTQAQKEERYPTVLLINQIRTKIGVMFGNPESMPGGHALDHASSLTVRVYGKNVIDKKVSDALPAIKETKVVINKWKAPIVSVNCEYNMVMIPHNGMKPGDTNEWVTLSNYLRDMGFLTNEGKTWQLNGKDYKTLKDMKADVESNPALLYDLKQMVINQKLIDVHGGPEDIHGVEKEPVSGDL